MILNGIDAPTLRSCAQPVPLTLIVLLRVFATGSFQAVLGDVYNISRQYVYYVLNDEIECIIGIVDTCINMPTSETELE